jgi:hypothetical protein
MDTADALHNSFEKLRDQRVNLVNLTHFKDFLEFSQKQRFFDAVSEWPVFQKTLKEWNSQCSIFG